MKFHHIGYLTNDIHKTSQEFFFLNLKKKKIIKDNKFKTDICFLEGKNVVIELVKPHKKNYGLVNLKKEGKIAYHIGCKSNNFNNDFRRLSKKFKIIVNPTKAIAFKNKRVAFLKKKDGYIIEIIEN